MDKGSPNLSPSAPMNGSAIIGSRADRFCVGRKGLGVSLREACGTARDGRRWGVRQGGTRVSVRHFGPVPVARGSEVRRWGSWQAGTRLGVRHRGDCQPGTRPGVRHWAESELAQGSTSVVEACATRRPSSAFAVKGRDMRRFGPMAVARRGSSLDCGGPPPLSSVGTACEKLERTGAVQNATAPASAPRLRRAVPRPRPIMGHSLSPLRCSTLLALLLP